MDNNISFTSRIRPVPRSLFSKTITPGIKSVEYPWTYYLTTKGEKAMTTGIQDCCAGGITDGETVVLFHVSPYSHVDGKKIPDVHAKLIKYIKQFIDVNNQNLQGFIIGSKIQFPASKKLFKNMEEFMQKHNIPYSAFKNKIFGSTDIKYDGIKDEWMVTNNYIDKQCKKRVRDPEKIMNKGFRSHVISNKDFLSM